jgi:hypothetical protein
MNELNIVFRSHSAFTVLLDISARCSALTISARWAVILLIIRTKLRESAESNPQSILFIGVTQGYHMMTYSKSLDSKPSSISVDVV